jgi:hypothetical protein
MERSGNKYEKAWRDRFEDAEIQHSEEIWTRIDSALANQQIRKYRRKILIYKWMAAASILFAIGIGYFSLRNNNPIPLGNNNPEIVSQDTPGVSDRVGEGFITGDANDYQNEETEASHTGNIQEQQAVAAHPEVRSSDALKPQVTGSQQKGERDSHLDFSSNKNNRQQEQKILLSAGTVEYSNQMKFSGQHSDSPRESLSLSPLVIRFNSRYTAPDIQINSPKKKKDPYSDDWYALYEATQIAGEDEKVPGELWAGVNFASGVFNPNISYGANPPSLANQALLPSGSFNDQLATVPDPSNNISNYMKATQPEESSYTPEFSYAYGVSFGYQISPKIMVRGGLSYLSNHTSTSVRSYINNPVTNKKMPNQALYSVSIESAGVTSVNTSNEDIQLNNTYEFISLPLSFGYYLIDKKVEWMLTAGLTTDFFLKNTISDPSNFLESKEIRVGNDSPYSSSYLNGTLGTLVNFSFAGNYRISLEPSYRLGLSDFAKDNAVFTSRPSTFFVTAGLSYIFK